MKTVMRFSDAGLADLQQWENKDGKPALRAYLDDAGVWTIATGHTAGVKRGDTCTSEQAARWLMEDSQACVDAANRYVQVELTQSQFDALVIWMFNVGVEAFLRSTALKLLNKGDYEGCSEWMQKFCYITDPKTGKKVKENGLVNRRAKEAALWTQDFTHTTNGSATPAEPPTAVTQTTTGKLQIGALVTGAAAAMTQGVATVQPVIDASKQVIGSVDGLSGVAHTVGAVLVGFSILFTAFTLWHKAASMRGAA